MDENSQKQILKILIENKRIDLAVLLINIFEDIDPDYKPESEEDEPYEEYYINHEDDEDLCFGIDQEGTAFANCIKFCD